MKVFAIIDSMLPIHEGHDLHTFVGLENIEAEEQTELYCWEERAIFMAEVEWQHRESGRDYNTLQEQTGTNVHASTVGQKRHMVPVLGKTVVGTSSGVMRRGDGACALLPECSNRLVCKDVDCMERNIAHNTHMHVDLAVNAGATRGNRSL